MHMKLSYDMIASLSCIIMDYYIYENWSVGNAVSPHNYNEKDIIVWTDLSTSVVLFFLTNTRAGLFWGGNRELFKPCHRKQHSEGIGDELVFSTSTLRRP